MSKTALIIGTSHSEAICRRNSTDDHIIRSPNRWHDNLEQHGFEVTNLSSSGCTAAQQFIMIHSYIQNNPSVYWDLVLIEGRSIETAVNIPVASQKGNNKSLYQFWEDAGDKKSKYWPFTRMDPDSINANKVFMENYIPWYSEYVFSELQAIENWSTNRALCSYLTKYAKVVKWFTLGTSKKFHKKWETDFRLTFGKELMDEFVLADTWPMLYFEHDPISDVCDCKHFNELGHKKFWQAIEERLKKENII